MPFSPLESYFLAEDLRQCMMVELATTSEGVTGLSSCVTWGNQTWDNCCPGQLRVGLERQYPTSRFPNPDLLPTVCQAGERGTDYRATLLRCAPNPIGDPPDVPCSLLDKHARIAHEDADAMWRAVRCCFKDTDFNYVIRELTPLGPRGACMGVSLLLTVGLMDWCVCHDG
jgi:hypothetical protein